MPLDASTVVDDWRLPAGTQAAVRLRAYGDDDDPLRLAVLLAEHLRSVDAELAEACLSRRTSWHTRRRSLGLLLDRASTAGTLSVALLDLDALAPVARRDDPAHVGRMRRDFFELVVQSVADGGWSVTRPSPRALVSESLETLPLADVVGQPTASVPPAFPPGIRPVASALVDKELLTRRDLERIQESVDDIEGHLVMVAYDALPTHARHALRVLAAHRAPSKLNGTCGDFGWADTVSTRALPRSTVQALRESGLLQSDDAAQPDQVRVPRRVREVVEPIARAVDRAGLVETHQYLAARPFEGRPPEEQLEIHAHAVRAGDVRRAKETARYYGTELRALATSLSRDKREFAQAADLFQHLVDSFDPSDAYCWEYLAYNLARDDFAKRAAGRNEARIRAAYEKAHRLEPRNPLYHGRLLGYRASRGDAVRGEVDRGLERYLREYDESSDAVSRFLEPVLRGLGTARTDERDALMRDWCNVLGRVAPRMRTTGHD